MVQLRQKGPLLWKVTEEPSQHMNDTKVPNEGEGHKVGTVEFIGTKHYPNTYE